MSDLNQRPYSSIINDGKDRAPNRSMLRAFGFEDEDFQKPIVGVASTWSMDPRNMHIDGLARKSEQGINAGEGHHIWDTTVSDGISMGTPGMRYSLVSREVIADSIETVVSRRFDGVVAIGGCDKNMPACLIALARLNRPSVFVWRHNSPRHPQRKACRYCFCLRSSWPRSPGSIDEKELKEIECRSIPGPDPAVVCTQPTLWLPQLKPRMSLPNSSAQLAVSKDKEEDSLNAGAAVRELVRKNIRPSDILTKKAFEN